MSDVVIVGGGFAGFWAAIAARRVHGPAGAISLINRGTHLVMRPRLYEAHPDQLAFPLREALALVDVELVLGNVISFDVAARRVELEDRRFIPFRASVLATGSSMRWPAIEGARAAFSIDDQGSAVAFDRHLAVIARRPMVSVAIVGAGFTGIELALELRERLEVHGRDSHAIAPRVVLLDRASVVGAELGAGPREVIERALDHSGVERRLGVGIAGLTATSLTFGGKREDFDAVVLCTGLQATRIDHPLDAPVDPLGRYEVDGTLGLPRHPNIFVAGDAASVDTGTGHLALQSCQHALQMGRVAGENAARSLAGRELATYGQVRYVTCLDLGRAGAVFTEGWERTVVDTGTSAKARKRRINREYIYPDLTGGRDGLLHQSELSR